MKRQNTVPSVLCALCAAMLAGAAWSQTGTVPPAANAAVTKATGPTASITLSMSDASLRDVARALSEQSGARVLIGPETAGRLTFNLAGVSTTTAVSTVARSTGNRWSRIILPADKAATLTPEQALTLVTAADALIAGGASVQVGEGQTISVVPTAADAPATTQASASRKPASPTASVYLIHTKADVAAIRAAREAAQKKDEGKTEAAQNQAVASSMSEDARQDPQLVNAYSAVQMLSPNQVATLAREYLIHSTPEQRQAIGDAISQQRDRIRDAMRNQQGQQ